MITGNNKDFWGGMTFLKLIPNTDAQQFTEKINHAMGYDYIAFDDHHFKEDLQYADAVPMFHRLQALADKEGLEFGLKLSNTFPVDVKAGELPSEEMVQAGIGSMIDGYVMRARLGDRLCPPLLPAVTVMMIRCV